MSLEIGKYNQLQVLRRVDFGYFLKGDSRSGDVLLPNNEIDAGTLAALEKGTDRIEVFLYLDQEERIIATTRKPRAQVGDFAYLEVAWVNNYGAFLDWGLLKDLFVPFREQKMKMQKGQSYIVHIHMDEESYRIMASAKVERYLSQDYPPYQQGDEVDVLVWQKTDLGLKVIVDNQFAGLLYDDQVFRQLRTGDRTKAYVHQVRPDGKLDLILQRKGQAGVRDFTYDLLDYLRQNHGYTVLGDKSSPEDIYEVFGVSKKVFKKAVGDLYKRHKIRIEEDGIHLTESGSAEEK